MKIYNHIVYHPYCSDLRKLKVNACYLFDLQVPSVIDLAGLLGREMSFVVSRNKSHLLM